MKFVLHRNPENRNQKIPFPAMQMAELADAEQLTIQADAGSILISREDITPRQAIITITHLNDCLLYTSMDLDKGMTELPLCRLVDLANSADRCV